MSQTQFDGPLASGNKAPGTPGGDNIGLAILAQSKVINAAAAQAVSATFKLPAGSQILEINPDVLTAFDGTTAPLTVGRTPGGSEYMAGGNAKLLGRMNPSQTGPQLAAAADIGANETVVATVTPTGANTVGQVRVTLAYVQTR